MPFTVNRVEGMTKDAEFEAYVRLLRQKGIDLGRLPRSPEPRTGRHWLYVWDSRDDAEDFANELNRRTGDRGWSVVEVAAPDSDGPMGPIIIQMGRRANGLVFGLHPLSLTMIRSAYPDARAAVAPISIHFDTLEDFTATYGSIEALARNVVAPTLTGLDLSALEDLGYALIEDDTNRTLVFVPPAELAKI